MKIGILGSGLMGGKLGTLFSRAGHDVVFSYARSEEKLKRLAHEAKGRACAGTPADAVRDADAVLLAVHWMRTDDVLKQAGELAGKTIITCSLPMSADDTGLVIGHTGSGAEELLKNAESDRLGGKFDLALQEYSDYVKQYGDTPMADVAQFQVGMLRYGMKDMEGAVRDFEALAEKYPRSKKLPDALFYKSKSLEALNRAADARSACQELRKRFATNDFAKQCAAGRQ